MTKIQLAQGNLLLYLLRNRLLLPAMLFVSRNGLTWQRNTRLRKTPPVVSFLTGWLVVSKFSDLVSKEKEHSGAHHWPVKFSRGRIAANFLYDVITMFRRLLRRSTVHAKESGPNVYFGSR